MLTVPPHAQSMAGGGSISSSGDEFAEARRQFTYGCSPTTPRSEERLLVALIRLLEPRLRHEWRLVDFQTADAVFAPTGTLVVGNAFLIPLGRMGDDRTTHIVPPIHPSDVLHHLDRVGEAISLSRPRTGDGAPIEPVASVSMDHKPGDSNLPTVGDSVAARMRLLTWPAYELIRSDPLGLRITTLLASREWSSDELATRLQIPRARCEQFLSLLVKRGYGAWVGPEPRRAAATAANEVSAANAASAQSSSQRQSLVAFIRRKLQI